MRFQAEYGHDGIKWYSLSGPPGYVPGFETLTEAKSKFHKMRLSGWGLYSYIRITEDGVEVCRDRTTSWENE